MEGFSMNNTMENKENGPSIEESIERIKNACVQAAEQYLENGDVLKEKIIDYYANRPETDEELRTILGKYEGDNRESYVQSYEEYANNETAFIENMERFFDHVVMYKREKELAVKPEVATEQEYELGEYLDLIEPQVRDAVVNMQKKGYKTFQSGFSEKNRRDQFFDFYNANVEIPEVFIEKLKEKSIEVKVEKQDDRTTVTFHPTTAGAVRLAEWKEIMDAFVEALPDADEEMVPNIKKYSNHTNFRAMQDLLGN